MEGHQKACSRSLPLELPPTLELAVKEADHDHAVEDAVWSHGFEVVPATTKSVLEFVRFAARLEPPFKAEDRGFRDAAHFYSVLEHLRDDPLESDEDEAIFLCTDKPFATSVAAIAANEQLRFVHEIQAVIEFLKPLLAIVDSDVLNGVAREWVLHVIDDIGATDLIARIGQGIERAELSTEYSLQPSGGGTIQVAQGEAAVAFVEEEKPRRHWVMVLPIEWRVAVFLTRTKSIQGGIKSLVSGGRLHAQISLAMTIESDDDFQPRHISYDSALLDWYSLDGGERVDVGGSPGIDVLIPG